MKFWLLTSEFAPFFGGGISTYCKHWVQILSDKGFHITVFLPDKNARAIEMVMIENIRVVRFCPYSYEQNISFGYETLVSFAFSQVIAEYLTREGPPDVLESQDYNGIAYHILQMKHLNYPLFKDLHVQIVCHAPSFLYFEYNKAPVFQLPYFWIGEMEKFTLRSADIIISPSKYIIDKIEEYISLPKNKTFIAHNPFSFEAIEENSHRDKLSAVFYGKLSPNKGIFELLSYFESLWTNGSQLKLTLIGDENYFFHPEHKMTGQIIRKKYNQFIADKKLILAGKIKPDMLQATIADAGFVIIPSIIDNFPYTVVECMAAGKLVMTSIQGGQSEIVKDGENGFLFDHDRPATFFEKIDTILNLDESSYKAITMAAVETIRSQCNGEKYYENRWSQLSKIPVSAANPTFPFTREFSVVKPLRTSIEAVQKNDLLTIVIPYFNLGRTIGDTVESIYSADYSPLEVIIVNDGSTDTHSINQLNILKQKFNDLQIIHKKNEGLAIARNTGAKQANGEFLAFLDADDKIHSTYFSKAIGILKAKSNVHFVGCWTQYFEKSKNTWTGANPEPPFLLVHNMINSSALVYIRNSFLQAGFNDSAFVFGMEDYDSVISMVKHGFKGVVIPELLFYYRIRPDSMARGFNRPKLLYLHQLLAKKHADFYAIFANEVSNILNANGPGYMYDNPTLDHHLYNGNPLLQRIIRKIKSQPILRKIAIKLYSKLK